MKLSPHFTLQEAIQSQAAIRKGIKNLPNDSQLKNMLLVAENILEPIYSYYGRVKLTSFFRSPELNKAIGGAATSQHALGEAVDFEITGVANKDVAKWIYDNLDYDQLILEFYDEKISLNSGWIHCSYRKFGNRKQCLTATLVKGKTHYSLLNLKDYYTLEPIISPRPPEENSLQKENKSNKIWMALKSLFN